MGSTVTLASDDVPSVTLHTGGWGRRVAEQRRGRQSMTVCACGVIPCMFYDEDAPNGMRKEGSKTRRGILMNAVPSMSRLNVGRACWNRFPRADQRVI